MHRCTLYTCSHVRIYPFAYFKIYPSVNREKEEGKWKKDEVEKKVVLLQSHSSFWDHFQFAACILFKISTQTGWNGLFIILSIKNEAQNRKTSLTWNSLTFLYCVLYICWWWWCVWNPWKWWRCVGGEWWWWCLLLPILFEMLSLLKYNYIYYTVRLNWWSVLVQQRKLMISCIVYHPAGKWTLTTNQPTKLWIWRWITLTSSYHIGIVCIVNMVHACLPRLLA